MGLGVAAIGLSRFETLAQPAEGPLFAAGQPIKLSSNENPYGPSPLARTAMAQACLLSNRYDWDRTAVLLQALATRHSVTEDNVMVHAGSTELLELVSRFAAQQKGNLVIADPSYAYWTGIAGRLGLEKTIVPLTPDKKIDLPAMLRAINGQTRLVYICNPNNPTGTLCDRNELIQFINEATRKTLVLVDEAYLDFTTQASLAPIAVKNKNLVVVKTFSKIYGLAGARIGYLLAHEENVRQLASLRSWNNGSVGVVSAAAAIASLKDEAFLREAYARNEAVRTSTIAQLEKMGMRCIPSFTNFIYFSLDNYRADYFQRLKEHNIAGTFVYEPQGKWTRITVGKVEEMQQFLKAIS